MSFDTLATFAMAGGALVWVTVLIWLSLRQPSLHNVAPCVGLTPPTDVKSDAVEDFRDLLDPTYVAKLWDGSGYAVVSRGPDS